MSGNPTAQSLPLLERSLAKTGMFLELTKAHLSLYIALSTVLGHCLAAGTPGPVTLVLGAWVWCLAAGAAIANNIQDRRFDRYFSRTRTRVLPRNRIRVRSAMLLCLLCCGPGLAGLYLTFESPLPFILGLAGLVCYNGLYTPLKKKSLWAYLPGIACGTLPPAIGWTAAPAAADPNGVYLVMLVLALWQVPHFLILALNRDRDMDAPAGFPDFTQQVSLDFLKIQVLAWIGLYSLAILHFIISGWIISPVPALFLTTVAVSLPVITALLIRPGRPGHWASFSFALLNLSMLAFMACGILDPIIA